MLRWWQIAVVRVCLRNLTVDWDPAVQRRLTGAVFINLFAIPIALEKVSLRYPICTAGITYGENEADAVDWLVYVPSCWVQSLQVDNEY